MNTSLSNALINTSPSGQAFNPLDIKNSLAGLSDAPAHAGSNAKAIDFSHAGNSGTSLENLSGGQAGQSANGEHGDFTKLMSQLMSEIMKALLPLLQQLTHARQKGDESSSDIPSASNGPANTQDSSATSEASDTSDVEDEEVPEEESPSEEPAAAQELNEKQAESPESSSKTESTSKLSGGGDLHLPPALEKYKSDILHAAKETKIPANVLAAQIWQESRGNLGVATVNGGNGLRDAGLMQVNSNTFADLQKKHPDLLKANANPDNPADNIMAGALYMKEQLKDFKGDMGAALRAYNSGPENVNTANLSDISKTGTGDSTYVNKVMNFANIISSGNGSLPA